MSSAKEEHPPAAPATSWFNNVFTCSACLTQVEWHDADTSGVDGTALRQDPSAEKAIEQHPHPGAGGNTILNNSLIDEDSYHQNSEQSAEESVHNVALDITIESYDQSHDEQLRRSPSPVSNHAIGIGEYSSTIGEFGSFVSQSSDEDDDKNVGECPICLHSMSTADVLHPLQCPGKNCSYNFCLQCMTSLVKASKDSYEMASDGSLHVKVHLNCPNCRASIKGIIEDTIRHRQDSLKVQVDEDNESSDDIPLIRRSRSTEEKMESVEFLDNKVTLKRLRNRARAPTCVRQKRKDDLIKELMSTPTPSVVRHQVLATHSHADIFGNGSQGMFASTISRPFHSGTMISPLDTEINGGSLRHSRSFDTDRRSPSSVMDQAFWTGEGEYGSSSSAKKGQSHQSQGGKQSDVVITGVEDDFLASLDIYWCCSSNDANASNIIDISGHAPKAKYEQGCGGYVDYIGTYHHCTANVKNGYAVEPCQGCVFRRGTYDVSTNAQHEEFYYDSDCGQQFAVGTWSPAITNHTGDASLSDASAGSYTSFPSHNRYHAKSLSRSRSDSFSSRRSQRSGRFRSSSNMTPSFEDNDRDSRASYNPSSPSKPIRAKQHTDEEDALLAEQQEQQAHIYRYFSQGGSPVRTGICSTVKAEIGDYVQDALNSRWRLAWHHVAAKDNPSPLHRHPTACEVWIERGYCRNRNEIVEPKLMWRELTQPGFKQGTLTESTMNPYRVSLFALRRIVPVADGDDWLRMSFDGQASCDMDAWKPMAKPNCLIAVKSSVGKDYLFEASCHEERDRIIHLWKMTTARLVSHAVVGNTEMMMNEFFNEAAIQGGLYGSMVTTSDGKPHNGR